RKNPPSPKPRDFSPLAPPRRHGPQIGQRHRRRGRRPGPRIRLRLHRSPLPRPPRAPLLLPPAAAHPPEAALQPGAPLPHDRLRPHPPHLLRRRLRPRLRRHRRAPRHRQRPGPRHRRRPPRRLPPRPRQRPVHHRGALLRHHVRHRRHRDHPPRPRRRPQQAPEPSRLLRWLRRRRHRHRVRYGHALPPHQDPGLPMVRNKLLYFDR
ncbi:Os02g0315400, partial [Oryza sativa Japonica Group]